MPESFVAPTIKHSLLDAEKTTTCKEVIHQVKTEQSPDRLDH